MHQGMKKPRSLKVINYAACLIGLSKYLAYFLGVTLSDKIVATELDEILSKNMPNSWS